jgi:outer membrane assembly lipoprotein YfiO
MKRWWLAATALLALVAGCGGSVLPQVHDERGRLELARRLYDKRDAALAIEVLAPYSTSSTGAADVDEAVYLLGLCHLQVKDWLAAQADFERLLRDYPESDSAGSAAFHLGDAFWGQSREPDFDQEYTLKALEQWMTFRRDRPDHWQGPLATRRIAEARTRLATKLYRTADLYVKLKEYEAARRYYKSVLTEYSETNLYGEAWIGWAVASCRMGERDTALAVLDEVEAHFAGTPLAAKASITREEVIRWKMRKIVRRSRPNEPPPPVASPSSAPTGGMP